MTTKVEFGEGAARGTGEIALPAGEGRGGALVVFHEYWGLNDHVRSLLGKFAAQGFVALGIDLYDGETTKDATEAGKLMASLDWGQAMQRTLAAVEFLKQHPRSNGKVGATGFCMGGALTFAATTAMPTPGGTGPQLAAAVVFYGVPNKKPEDYDAVRVPILAHFAKTDTWAKVETGAAIRDRINAKGGSMQLEIYDAEHAFVNDTRPEVYSPENAKLALDRTYAFFKKHLA